MFTFALIVAMLAGCALWKPESWNLDRFRDERARDIDSRLSSDRTIVDNPFH
jgi:hypothetical protein